MENLVFTQLSISEIRKLFRQELESFFANPETSLINQPDSGDLLTVEEAAKFLSLSVPTIYSLISKGEIPVMKRSKRCYFSRKELMEYLKEGRRKTNSEIRSDAEKHLNTKKK